MSNLDLWESVEKTDKAFTKDFTGAGGFKGTAINPTYLVKKATSLWGPMGGKWKFEKVSEEIITGQPYFAEDGTHLCNALVHKFEGRLIYPCGDGEAVITHYGSTDFVGKNRNGFFTDGEAFKKSITDCLSKCLSLAGFSSDIYLGQFDDNKHVNKPEHGEPEPRKEPVKDQRTPTQKGESILARVSTVMNETQLDAIVNYKEYPIVLKDLLASNLELHEKILLTVKQKRQTFEGDKPDDIPDTGNRYAG